ncbi:MAG TPA: Maf family protein, partial [Terriglobia bacterium]|nr:Maf family protein [Terriglobia bacterium]
EARRQGESAEDYVRRLAREKALSVARAAPPGTLVLGADTAVVAAGQILGKPADAADAARMLRLLSGATHRVLTGVCVARAPEKVEALRRETTTVIFNPLTEEEIQRYVASGEPLDKAGGYGIQGLASKFARRVEGCFFNVVGLPVPLVYNLLSSIPHDLPAAKY